MQNNTFLSKNTLFGVFVGLTWIMAAVTFYVTGKGITANPVLNNVIMLLTIIGAFIGVRKYREDNLQGQISYSQALGACVYIIAVAAFCYGIYIYGIYKMFPDLRTEYLTMTNAMLKEIYNNNPLLENILAMMDTLMTPGVIAFAEVFNKIFSGFIFSLLLAGMLRKKNIDNNINTAS